MAIVMPDSNFSQTTVCACNLNTVFVLQLEFTPDSSASLTPLPRCSCPPCRCNAMLFLPTKLHHPLTRSVVASHIQVSLPPGRAPRLPPHCLISEALPSACCKPFSVRSAAQPPPYSVARIGMVTRNPPQGPTHSSSQQSFLHQAASAVGPLS
jgi:hypothetical protein